MVWSLYDIARFGDFRDDWAQLNDAGFRSVLLDPRFVAPLIEEFGTGRETLAICRNGGDPVAMGLFSPAKLGAWQTFQPPQAPLGLWLHRPNLDVEPMLDALLVTLPGCNLIVALLEQDPDLVPRPNGSARITTLDYIPTARITLSASFEDFAARVPKTYRKNLKRRRNGLARRGITPRLEEVRGRDTMAAAVDDFARLESAGWKGRRKTAVEVDGPQGRFYRKMMTAFAEAGQARIYRLFYGERLVASDMCLTRDETMVILKTTYDESERASAPTQLMRWLMLERLFEAGDVTTIESYGRPHSWHRNMSADIRIMYHLNLYRWPSLGAAHRGWSRLRHGAGAKKTVAS